MSKTSERKTQPSLPRAKKPVSQVREKKQAGETAEPSSEPSAPTEEAGMRYSVVHPRTKKKPR